MSEDNLPQEIQQKVFERIRGGKARVHTRAYFAARIILTAAVALLALAVSTFVLSFILFSVHESGEQFLLGFGGRGVATFLALFPWLLLIADIVLLFVLEWLLQGFKWGYRFSLLSVFLTVLILSAALATLLSFTPLHRALLDRADRNDLPVVGNMYENIRSSHGAQGVFRGTITSIRGNEIVITHDDGDHDEDDGTWTVTLPQRGVPALSIGDRVYVFGSSNGQSVEAYGIQMLSPDQ